MINYILRKKLAESAFSSVYLYQSRESNEIYAIKEIKVNPEGTKQFIQETMIYEKLKGSQNIVIFIEKFSDTNKHYIVLEYCEGGTLEHFLSQNRFIPYSKKMSLITDILRSLKSLHDANIAHRDLKTTNFFITNGVVKLGDFGISKYLAADSGNTFCGTLLYMAPEVSSGNYNLSADIWSIGAVFYEILKGSHPFPANTVYELIDMIKEPIDYSGLPQDQVDFLSSALEKDKKKRASLLDLIKSEFISSHLNSIFFNICSLFNYLEPDQTYLSKITQLAICIYFIKENLYLEPKNSYNLAYQNLLKELGFSVLTEDTKQEILKSLIEMSSVLNESNTLFSSYILYIYRRISILTFIL